MNEETPRTRTGRRHGLRAALCLLPLILAASVPPAAAGDSPAVALSVPGAPGVRAPGLRYFRLEPTVRDTVFRLLVIPVQFPEDRILGGGSREELEAKLNGASASLARYYLSQTGERLRIESTLAPTVTAGHDRDYYTVDGGGYGNDPDSYPNNAQRLVEEATASLDTGIDFRSFDNTGDGITDGLLVLHSGPRSAETGLRLDPDVLIAHAFTVPAPVPRGGGTVFPYAVAATRDGLGIWAHEVGHLLGLADLYAASGICPGPGVGEWSLMATGSNREGGENPTGLDAFSRQLLGLVPEFEAGAPVGLGEGAFLRAADSGQERGPRYYLVEARESGDGPAGETPARVVYFVDEEAGDNRSCPLPEASYRPLVRVAAVLCPGSDTCIGSFEESCPGSGGVPRCLPVAFHFRSDSVLVTYPDRPPVRIARVGLSVPRSVAGAERQRAHLTLENVSRTEAHTVTFTALAVLADSVCVVGPSPGGDTLAWERTLEPGETTVDSTLALVPCSGSGPLVREEVRLVLRTDSEATGSSRVDTLSLPAGEPGLSDADWARFSIRNLAPARRSPWQPGLVPGPGPCDPGCPPDRLVYAVVDPDRLAHGELRSPWFLVPADARLVVEHAWNLASLSADVALDAGRILLRAQGSPDLPLTPPGGWGFTAERSIGNAFGGGEVLSGSGNRPHAFDLSAHAGEVVQIVCAAAGDADPGPGEWTVASVRVLPAPGAQFLLYEDSAEPGTLRARASGAYLPGTTLHLFRGLPATHPVSPAATVPWDGAPTVALGHYEGSESRFELLWTDTTGAGDAVGDRFELPVSAGPGLLLPPHPNPVRSGETQTWTLLLADDAPPGTHSLRVLTLSGGVVWRGSVRIDEPGMRLVLWDLRDEEGRAIPSGVYFLEARRPDGAADGTRIVVIP